LIGTGGLAVTGGCTIRDNGVLVENGGVAVSQGGLSVTGQGVKVTGGLTVTDGVLIGTSGLTVSGGITVQNTGMLISAGGLAISQNGLSVGMNGVKVTGGITVTDGLVVGNGGLSVSTGGLVVGGGGLTVTGNLYVTGTITATATVTAPVITGGTCCTSDIRLKQNIASLENPLEKISRLRGVYFHWNRTVQAVETFSDKRHVGVIAQEVQEVLPEIVGNTTDNYLGVDYAFLTPLLIEGVKELSNHTQYLFGLMKETHTDIGNSTTFEGSLESDDSVTSEFDNVEDIVATAAILKSTHDSLSHTVQILQAQDAEFTTFNKELVAANRRLEDSTIATEKLYYQLLQRVAALEEVD